jgi:hypothetical protein
MGKHLLIVATTAALFANLFPTRPSRADEKLDSKTIARLITQLGSSNFGDREEATRALVQIGPAARGPLEKAAAGKDAEVRRRAEIVLERIEKDLDTAALLVPKRIRLNFQDTPITDAVAELAKKTGFAIQFEGDRTRLANRKITLDTGEIPFWDALDQFCRNAGLVERGPVPPKNNQAAANNEVLQNQIIFQNQRRMLMARRGLNSPVPNSADAGRIVLVEGKPDSLPHWYAGAVRIRALPPSSPGAGQIKTQEETYITLEIAPQPKMAWQGILDVRIDKAVDQAGQSLSYVLPASGPGNEFAQEMNAMGINAAWMMNGNVIVMNEDGSPVDMTSHQRQMPVRFKLAGKPSQVLKEIHGTVAAQVLTPHQPLITVENILKAQDRTVKGPERSYLKVLEVSRLDHGQIKLRIEVRPPPMGMNGLPMFGGGGRVFVQRFNGKMAVMAMQDVDNNGVQSLTLQDAKGQNFQLVNIDETPAPNGNNGNQEYHLVFQSRPGLGEATKLAFSGRRMVTIEIPFTLKDVPLP